MAYRYERNILIPSFGEAGQEALHSARVGVLGAGGLGSPVLYYLAAAGVGYLKVADFDDVEESNLQRQILHDTGRIGMNKAASAAKTLRAINPDIVVEEVPARITSANVKEVFGGLDVLIEASDNFEAKFMLADYCAKSGQPLVWGSAVGMHAMVSTFTTTPLAGDETQKTATLRDLYPTMPPAEETPTAATSGVMGPLVGVAGSLMSMEAIKIIANMPGTLVRRLALIDLREPGMRIVEF
ncbi:MAG: HesA/MoeB/ThiF family protein [Actinomycetaceae bacterium]|nr:HesA/MoeB/ThiF family protein [Actinomycetaceae bacterium]